MDAQAAKKLQAYSSRRGRVATLRALRAATEQRFADVLTHAEEAMRIAGKVDPEGTAFVLAEYARAMLGQKAQAATATTAPNVKGASARELRYWDALTALARKDYARGFEVATAALSAPAAAKNVELSWRLGAIAAIAARNLRDGASDGATMRSRETADFEALTTAWSAVAPAYFKRPDLLALQQRRS
jgi:hypothetical protein